MCIPVFVFPFRLLAGPRLPASCLVACLYLLVPSLLYLACRRRRRRSIPFVLLLIVTYRSDPLFAAVAAKWRRGACSMQQPCSQTAILS
jgi:hypothetical protein